MLRNWAASIAARELPFLVVIALNPDYLIKNIKIINSFKYKAISYLPNPSTRAGYDTRSILKRSLTGLNSEFSFS